MNARRKRAIDFSTPRAAKKAWIGRKNGPSVRKSRKNSYFADFVDFVVDTPRITW